MSQLLFILILNLFSITNQSKDSSATNNKSIIYKSYYTQEELQNIQTEATNIFSKRTFDLLDWYAIDLQYNENYKYISKPRRLEFEKVKYLENLDNIFVIEYILKKKHETDIKHSYFCIYENYVKNYNNRKSCLKRNYFSLNPSKYNIDYIFLYSYKDKLKKQDFLDNSFLLNLEYPQNKTSSIILEEKNSKKINFISRNSVFPDIRNQCKTLLIAKDSLHIKTFFQIENFGFWKIFGLSENGIVYILNYSKKEKKYIMKKLEEYVNDNPKLFKNK